jgi:predicted nuclease of predicted toxin-antitoxin system
LSERNEDDALFAIARMKQGKVVDLTTELALSAVEISRNHKLPMADSIIYETARKYNCLLWTQDSHFQNPESVKYFEKSDLQKHKRIRKEHCMKKFITLLFPIALALCVSGCASGSDRS